MSVRCRASIVLYHTPEEEVRRVKQLLEESGVVSCVRLVDNGLPGANRGYGAGHNIALRESIAEDATYHLVLNSDISFRPEDIALLLRYMDDHPDVAMLQPRIVAPTGEVQVSCRLIPTPLDLIGRRFFPAGWREKKRNRRYEMHDSGYDREINAPVLSGCFMLLRVSALKEEGLFDERFFMYPEDIDLSRRLHRRYRTMLYPAVSITHDHRQASYHSLRMLWIHCVNIIRYFNKWGWFFDGERTRFNREAIRLYLSH